MIPKGVSTAYPMRILYFDVIFRQGLPKAFHFSSTSSASCSFARSSLKATTSAINRRMSIPERVIARILWATDRMARSNLIFVGFRRQGRPVDRS
jgi:hypothetical protein